MDVVMQFAVSKLGFHFSDIVIYAWSIGGFSASWAAMNYPDIKGLVSMLITVDKIKYAECNGRYKTQCNQHCNN